LPSRFSYCQSNLEEEDPYMPLSAATAKTRYLDREETSPPSRRRSQPAFSGLAFLLLCVLILLGATHPLDWWGQKLLAGLSSPWLDVTGFVLTLLGEAPITGALAILLAVRGWRRSREQGLGPLLLFVGVGIEVLLKSVLPHPGPAIEFARPLYVPEFLRRAGSLLQVSPSPVWADLALPYAFPSGHMLRTTFLVTVASTHRPRLRLFGYLLVLSMAVTRVYCNEHWASDVVGGTLLGWTLAGVTLALEEEPSREAVAV
jgi:membrane-associated phospholipid phosphatase